MTNFLLYGGTFDPPHHGHTQVPFAALQHLDFDKVLYVPAHISPLKNEPTTDPAHRLAMLKLALSDASWAEISTIELDRKGTSYAIDTIESLLNDNDTIRLLIGADQWQQFHLWYRYEDILTLADPVVMPRDGIDIEGAGVLPIPPMPAMSTTIRGLVQRGEPIDGLVDTHVVAYIAQHGLYV